MAIFSNKSSLGNKKKYLQWLLNHGVVIYGVVIYGEDTYRKVVFYLSALKPEAEMVSEASRGRYDLDKPENIMDCY